MSVSKPHTDREGCRVWLNAQCRGTDAEMFGALIYESDGEWRAGSSLEGLEYCPWCGASLSEDQP